MSDNGRMLFIDVSRGLRVQCREAESGDIQITVRPEREDDLSGLTESYVRLRLPIEALHWKVRL